MKTNKYLRELGYEWYDMPGSYIDENTAKKLGNDNKTSGCLASDCRNEEDEEGFCDYEFFNLDNTLSLYIYSKMCYFRDNIANICTPGCLSSFNTSTLDKKEKEKISKEGHKKWLEIINKICEAFKLKITGERKGYEGIDGETIREGMQLFIEYYDCLWY